MPSSGRILLCDLDASEPKYLMYNKYNQRSDTHDTHTYSVQATCEHRDSIQVSDESLILRLCLWSDRIGSGTDLGFAIGWDYLLYGGGVDRHQIYIFVKCLEKPTKLEKF